MRMFYAFCLVLTAGVLPLIKTVRMCRSASGKPAILEMVGLISVSLITIVATFILYHMNILY